jgi:uncharacterized membrane protein YgdD (TMEM256/DUF423 family)
MRFADRLLVLFAGLAGLAGVALAAYAAHVKGGALVANASQMLLFHAPALGLTALLAAAAVTNRWMTRLAGWVMLAGLVLFCGDLAMRNWQGVRLLPMAAPIGGIALMTGWGLLASAAIFTRGR